VTNLRFSVAILEMETPTPFKDHEKLFDEIAIKLQQLSQRKDQNNDVWSEKINRIQEQLSQSQEQLKNTQEMLKDKIQTLGDLSFVQSDLNHELKRLTEQLENERKLNTKLSSDLARSLELNLKFQLDIEEIRTKANNLINEERKLNQFLADKNKSQQYELDLARSMQHELRAEFDKYRAATNEKLEKLDKELTQTRQQLNESSEKAKALLAAQEELQHQLNQKDSEIEKAHKALEDFHIHSETQTRIYKEYSEKCDIKFTELKVALEKKSLEAQDYYNHLQQVLTQLQLIKQENGNLKDYISKVHQLYQSKGMEFGQANPNQVNSK
jgi:chromosome segregation ATPase